MPVGRLLPLFSRFFFFFFTVHYYYDSGTCGFRKKKIIIWQLQYLIYKQQSASGRNLLGGTGTGDFSSLATAFFRWKDFFPSFQPCLGDRAGNRRLTFFTELFGEQENQKKTLWMRKSSVRVHRGTSQDTGTVVTRATVYFLPHERAKECWPKNTCRR